ncbi:MAG: DUF1598 domain-containing protein [bacterium]|nr:DUF1598 domain-containing protein [bacterium]
MNLIGLTSEYRRCRNHIACALLLVIVHLICYSTVFSQTDSSVGTQIIQSVSLRSIENAMNRRNSLESKPLPFTMFRDFSQIIGFVVDSTSQDIVLLATKQTGLPTLHPDDFIVGYNNVFIDSNPPYCSLDPDPVDINEMSQITQGAKESGISDVEIVSEWMFRRLKQEWGTQKVVIEGVPKNSRFACKMVEVDYHMKKISLGITEMDSITSYIDRVAESGVEKYIKTGVTESPISLTRFWFHIELPPEEGGTGQYRFPTFSEAEGIVLIDQCPIVLLTEQQLLYAKNKLGNSRSSDRPAQEFADEFSNRFASVSRIHSGYAELENYFRLIAMLRAMKFKKCYEKANWQGEPSFTKYRFTENETLADTVTGLVNLRKHQTEVHRNQQHFEIFVCPVVCGGVDMNFPITDSQFSENRKEDLVALKQLILTARRADSTGVWSVPVPDSLLRRVLP